MTFLIGLMVVALFFLAMRYFTNFDIYQQMSIAVVILSIIAVAIMYNEYTKQESQKVRDAVLQFNQGKTLHCDGKEVNSTNYTLSIGTYTFIGKKGTANFEEMIGASNCE